LDVREGNVEARGNKRIRRYIIFIPFQIFIRMSKPMKREMGRTFSTHERREERCTCLKFLVESLCLIN
jgi:hypothetical protein